MKRTNTEENHKQGKEIDIQWFLNNLFRHWKLFLVSVLLCMLTGYAYLRYVTKVYNVSAAIILKDNKRGGMGNSELSVYEGMRLMNPNNNVDNEVEMLASRNMVENVVKELGLYTRYTVEGKFKDTELYGNENPLYYRMSPLVVYLDPTLVSKMRSSLEMDIEKEDGKIEIEGSYGKTKFQASFNSLPAILETPAGKVLLQPTSGAILREDYPIHVNIMPPLYIARSYLSRLNAESTSKTTSVVRLSLKETHRKRGEDFLEKLIEVYNRDAMEDKNKAATNAARFINERLAYINQDLDDAENNIAAYRRDNQLTDIIVESKILLEEDNDFEKQLVGIGTQAELLSLLESELKKNQPSLLPSNLGFSDQELVRSIGKYNDAVLEYERLLNYTSPETPMMRRVNEHMESFHQEVVTHVSGLRKSLNAKMKDLKEQSNEYDSDLEDIPRREQEFTEMSRQQKIKESLYITLLEKKEEAELSLAITAPSAKVMESPLAGTVPVTPRKMICYAICLLLGVSLPFVGLGIMELINYKIESEEEVRRQTRVPVVIALPMDKTRKSVVVTAHATTPIVERFRLLRTNLQFSLDDPQKKVVLVTSTISGEGKTFVSINLAMIFALKYKTLLIGLDIRRPKLDSYMDLPKKAGIVSYLKGATKDVESLIHHNVRNTALDVMMAGMVPPNPNELLMEPALDELFFILRQQYEYIIVDTSPVGSVSDTFLLNRIADASLFVVRQDYTPKAALSLAENIHVENRLQKLSLVLNGFSGQKAGRYGYGYGYGYGYSSKEE